MDVAAAEAPDLVRRRESRLTAAIPMDDPYCSCKLTRVRSFRPCQPATFSPLRLRTGLEGSRLAIAYTVWILLHPPLILVQLQVCSIAKRGARFLNDGTIHCQVWAVRRLLALLLPAPGSWTVRRQAPWSAERPLTPRCLCLHL